MNNADHNIPLAVFWSFLAVFFPITKIFSSNFPPYLNLITEPSTKPLAYKLNQYPAICGMDIEKHVFQEVAPLVFISSFLRQIYHSIRKKEIVSFFQFKFIIVLIKSI